MSQTKRASSHNRLLNYQPLLSEREFASSREWGGGGGELVLRGVQKSFSLDKQHFPRIKVEE